ncbi:branched-chain-amino-acid transaminase [bacterium]|nr:branched-chain-amino-acid transaminase [bacterium]
MLIYLNGKLVPKEEAKVSVFDHGFLYGDGVFEGIRIYNGRIFKLKEHIERLFYSAHAIDLKPPLTQEELLQATVETVRANNLRDGYIRIVISRGEGDLGLDPQKCPNPTVVIIADKIAIYPEEVYKKGMKIITVSTRRNSPQALNPNIKSLNYLNNILAKIEANRANVPEAIMLSIEGYVAEATGDNIFIVKNKTLITPPLHLGVLPGITRQTVIDLAKERGIITEEKPFTLYEVYTADECFLTGTAAEIVPVVEVDGREINGGVPGEITLLLMKDFHEYVKTEGVEVYK